MLFLIDIPHSGPGCSSVGGGFMTELGPFFPLPGGRDLQVRGWRVAVHGAGYGMVMGRRWRCGVMVAGPARVTDRYGGGDGGGVYHCSAQPGLTKHLVVSWVVY